MSIADLLSHNPTVAVLNARGELRRLRMLVNPNDDAVRAELDRLEEVIGDLCDVGRLVENGDVVTQETVDREYVSKESYDELRDDSEREKSDLETERDDARRERDELQEALDADEDETKQLLVEAQRAAGILREQIARTEKQRDALRSPVAPRVRQVLMSLHPGRRSPAKLEMFLAVQKAVEAALDGKS